MREHILNVIQALHQNRELIADAYCRGQGVAPEKETEAAFTRLLKVKALAPYIEGSFRLDRRLRVFFDRAVNRVKIYGNSTHYAHVVGKLEGMLEAYQGAMIAADAQSQEECIDEIIDLCDEFATGMKEDIEHFRMVVDTRKGFSGGALKDRLFHNRNYVAQASQMVEAVGLLDQADLLDAIRGFMELTNVLQRHLYNRVEGSDDLRRRLFEVQQALNAALFDLQAAHHLVEVLLRLDDRLVRQADFEPPVWEDDGNLPDMLFRFPGFPLPSYPDPNGDDSGALLSLLMEIRDDRRPSARPTAPRAGCLDDAGEPPPSKPSPSEFRRALNLLLAEIDHHAVAISVMTWLRTHRERETLYPYSPVIWLGTLSCAIDNGLTAPDGWRYRHQVAAPDLRWETPVLTDIWLELHAADTTHPSVAARVPV
jgi:hypothetical protein